MKQWLSIWVGAALLFSGGMSAAAHAENNVPAPAVVDEAKLEQQIKDQDDLIRYHTAMKRDAQVKYFSREKNKWGPFATSKLREVDIHCDEIIRAARETKDKLTALAKWHKEQSSEKS